MLSSSSPLEGITLQLQFDEERVESISSGFCSRTTRCSFECESGFKPAALCLATTWTTVNCRRQLEAFALLELTDIKSIGVDKIGDHDARCFVLF